MDLSVVIVSYKSSGEIKNCLETIEKHFCGFVYEVIVVNNYTPDAALAAVAAEYPGLILLESGENKGFGYACNVGLEAAKGRYVCFLNPDTLVINNPQPALDLLDKTPKIGLLGPLLRNQDGSLQRSCYQIPAPRNWFSYQFYLNAIFPKVRWWGNYPRFDFTYQNNEEVGWVSGAYMLMPAALAKEIGGFDERFFLYCEDLDLCWKVRDAGKEVWFTNCCAAIHLGGSSTGGKNAVSAKRMADAHFLLFSKRFLPRDGKKCCGMPFGALHCAGLALPFCASCA